jgi:tetratricopeptide (TPR) repeat protein
MKKRLLIIHFLLFALSFSVFSQLDNDKEYKKGVNYMRKYQRVQAQVIFDGIIKEDPNYINAYYQRGIIHQYYKKDSLAILDYTVVSEKHNDKDTASKAHTKILDILFKKEESCSSQSKKHIAALKSLDSDNYKGSLYDGICKLHSGEFQESVNELTKAYNLNHENKISLYYRARAEIELENYITAIEDLTKAIEDKPKKGDPYFWRAYAYYELAIQPGEKHSKKYLQAALADLDLAIKYRVRVEEAYFDRAEVKFELQDYEGAIKDFKKVLSKNSKNMDARYQKALCYYHYGQEYYAIKDLKYIIKKDTNYVDAYYDLAVIYHEKDELEQALEYANQTIKLDHEHADAYIVRGLILIDLERIDEACQDFKKADQFGDEDAHHDVKKYCK